MPNAHDVLAVISLALGGRDVLAARTYAVVSLLSVIVFHLTRQYNFLRFSQLLLILVLPFLLMIALGGFVTSSAVILWAVVSPLGALVFDQPAAPCIGWRPI